MNHIQGYDRGEVLLFPEAIDDYITDDNPVRVIDVFVGQFDLAAHGFKHAVLHDTGRPPYHPADLLRLYLYGYLNRVRSSRRLEREAVRNLELIWLLRKLRPDFKTIADFRKDNGKGIKAVCREFTLLCRKLDLFGGELVAIDSTKIKAQNSKHRNYNQAKLRELIGEIDRRVNTYLGELEEGDRQESDSATGDGKADAAELKEKIAQLQERKAEYEALSQQLEESGATQVSVTDPDSRAMSMGQGAIIGYNVQAAVDDKHNLVLDTGITNTTSDLNVLGTMAIKAQEALGRNDVKVVADKGYYNGKEVLACDSIGVTAYVAKPLTSANTARGLYGKESFTYDTAKDCYYCPAGKGLTYRFSTHELGRPIRYYRASECKECPIKARCTRNQQNRTITRLAFEEVQEAMQERVRANPQIMRKRKAIIEHVFGTIKRSLGYDYFLCRGNGKVATEVNLTMLAYNLKRVCNIIGVPELIRAVS
jgi:transposase